MIKRFGLADSGGRRRLRATSSAKCMHVRKIRERTTWLIPLKSPRQLSFFPSLPEGCHPDLVMFLTLSIVDHPVLCTLGIGRARED